MIVGFAAETGDPHGDVLDHGRAKLARKGCDLLVVNAVGDGQAFGQPDNAAVILGADGIRDAMCRSARKRCWRRRCGTRSRRCSFDAPARIR